METYFEKDSLILPALSDEYCNSKEIIDKLEKFDEHFDDLVNQEDWRKGKMINFYPMGKNFNSKAMKDFHIKRHRWLRPQDQGNEVQERFNTAYRKHLKSGQMPFKKDVTGYLEWDPYVVFSIKPKSDDIDAGKFEDNLDKGVGFKSDKTHCWELSQAITDLHQTTPKAF